MDKETLLNYMNNRKQECALEIVEVSTGKRQVLAEFDYVIEAPNWLKDGKTLIYNSNGKIHRFDMDTCQSELIDTGFADMCNNDHVLSPDNKSLAISHFALEDMTSRIYLLPIEGGVPKCVTENGPSYLHGWSPDGCNLAYCANRFEQNYDVYTISVDGGNENQLTSLQGMNDGPEYDPSGKKIWFNSTRSGLMQIWSMNIDGSDQTRMTNIEMNCWFPHVSPDSTQVAYLAFRTDELKPEEHLPDKHVQIRVMDVDGKNDRVLLEFLGGQGSINVNSWSLDSKYVALVTYE